MEDKINTWIKEETKSPRRGRPPKSPERSKSHGIDGEGGSDSGAEEPVTLFQLKIMLNGPEYNHCIMIKVV